MCSLAGVNLRHHSVRCNHSPLYFLPLTAYCALTAILIGYGEAGDNRTQTAQSLVLVANFGVLIFGIYLLLSACSSHLGVLRGLYRRDRSAGDGWMLACVPMHPYECLFDFESACEGAQSAEEDGKQGSAISIEPSEASPLAGHQIVLLDHPQFQTALGTLFRPPLMPHNVVSRLMQPYVHYR